MIRINIFLILILIACALSVVTSQHKARKLFVELEKEQELAGRLAVEWGQLQLEQSTWATHARIEKVATGQLNMHVPDAFRVQIIPLSNPADSANSINPADFVEAPKP
ncbi:MAG: cell division protein FtsL [Nitrosospira sp.]|nr:cell division protein FtsL [Nitrosospira sp.]MDN5881105.1 cell division protein FtsL [Nitrosospira sp.]